MKEIKDMTTREKLQEIFRHTRATQAELGKSFGYSQQFISSIYNDQKVLTAALSDSIDMFLFLLRIYCFLSHGDITIHSPGSLESETIKITEFVSRHGLIGFANHIVNMVRKRFGPLVSMFYGSASPKDIWTDLDSAIDMTFVLNAITGETFVAGRADSGNFRVYPIKKD